jgi:hypothetical protein
VSTQNLVEKRTQFLLVGKIVEEVKITLQTFSPGLVVLQGGPRIDAPTVSKGVVPPELKPVASDIVNKNCDVACIWSSIEKDPDPLLNADIGIGIFCGVPKTYLS